jgi:phosphohistidine swiveling domain-containing protein
VRAAGRRSAPTLGGASLALAGERVYSNRIARDMLPGVIKPLVWTVNTSIVNAAWVQLLEEVLGPLDIRPQDLTRSFGYRAYFDMTTFATVFEALGMPGDSLELMMGLHKDGARPRMHATPSILRHVRRMAATGRRTMSRGRWVRAELRSMEAAYAPLAALDPAQLDEAALLDRADEIATLARRAAYANIVVPMTQLAYERSLWRLARMAGVDPAVIDPADGRADRLAWDPNAALDDLRDLASALPTDARRDLEARRAAALRDGVDGSATEELARAFDAFAERFGHLSGSTNDFTRSPWRENRDVIVDLVLAHPPRARSGARVGPAVVEAGLPLALRPAFRLLWRRSGAFHVYRQAVGTTWNRSYGLLRGTFLTLGARFVARGLVDRPDDVFYLTLDEVRELAVSTTAGDPPGNGAVAAPNGLEEPPRAVVARRRREVEEAADLEVPEIVRGDTFVPCRRAAGARSSLAGTGASPGVVRARARVILGSEDFSRVRPGDVIVIPFSDVAWTPLFARAAGVVAEETGGILCHTAVVSREYEIPCVVGVEGACSAIPDGATVVVDGTTGEIRVVEQPPA